MYRRIGYASADLFPLLITAVKYLLSKDGAMDQKVWENKIADPYRNITSNDVTILKENISKVILDLIPIYGNYYFTSASQICELDAEVRYFFGWYLNLCGRITDPQNLPVRIKKYTSHLVTSQELLEAFISTKIIAVLLPGSATDQSGKSFKPPLKRDLVISCLVQACQAVIQAASLMPSYRDIMVRYGNTLMYKVKNSERLDQFDKTFLSHCLDPEFLLGTALAAAKDAAFDSDSIILFNELKNFIGSYFMPGPFSQVAGILSTGGLVDPMVYVGPFTSEVILVQGRIVPFFKVVTLYLNPVERFAWNPDTLRKYQTMKNAKGADYGVDGVVLPGSVLGDTIGPLDEQDVEYRYNRFREAIEPHYYSTLFSKEMIIKETVTPQHYYIERFGIKPVTKSSALGLQTIDQFHVADISLILADAVSTERSATFKVAKKVASQWALQDFEVNLRPAFPGGNVFVRPIISEKFVVDQSDLLTPQSDIVGMIQGQLGLSDDEASQSRHILAYQFNAWKFRELLGIKQKFLGVKEVTAMVTKLFSVK